MITYDRRKTEVMSFKKGSAAGPVMVYLSKICRFNDEIKFAEAFI